MGKKIVKTALLLIFILIISIFFYIGWIFYDSVRTHITEIDLTQITAEEKDKLIELNFLELEQYPQSIQFLSLKSEKMVRETQYYITFSVDKEEANNNEIIRSTTGPNQTSIEQLQDEENTMTYLFSTHFAQNTTGNKWSFLHQLIEKYK